MRSIVVLLTVFNRKDKTLQCLQKIWGQSIPKDFRLEVYLTDDGCTDGTPDEVTAQFPDVNIIKGDGTLFWNRGMVEAWKVASKSNPDFYLLLNDDTYLIEGALEILIKKSAMYNHKSVIVGSTLDSKQEKITYGGRMKKKFELVTDIKNVENCDTFNANVVLIPKLVYEKIGILDSTFHHAMGDYDYGFRVTESGLKCIVCDFPVGICDTHPTLPKWCDSNENIKVRLKSLYQPGGNGSNPFEYFIFKKRHYGLLSAIKSFITSHVHSLCPYLWGNKTY